MTQLFRTDFNQTLHQLFTQHHVPAHSRPWRPLPLELRDKGTRFVLSSFSTVGRNHKMSVWIGPEFWSAYCAESRRTGDLNIPCRHRVLVGVAEIEGEQIDLVGHWRGLNARVVHVEEGPSLGPVNSFYVLLIFDR
jgi:hypothetical protein